MAMACSISAAVAHPRTGGPALARGVPWGAAVSLAPRAKLARSPQATSPGLGGIHPAPRAAPAVSHSARAVAASASATEASTQPGLVFDLGGSHAWDAAHVQSPVIRCYLGDNEQRWMMWYEGRAAGAEAEDVESASSPCIGIALSEDGITWSRSGGLSETIVGDKEDEVVGMVLAPNEDDWWWFDTCHLTISDCQVLSNPNVQAGEGAVYWMFYSGGDYEELPLPDLLAPPVGKAAGVAAGAPVPGIRQRPGLALSQDGRNWARIEGSHHSGALFDLGEEGEWDSLYISRPQVIREGPRDFRMFYQSLDPSTGRFSVGLATSQDGFSWDKAGKVFAGGPEGSFDARGAASHCVTRNPEVVGEYLMFYEAVAEDGSRSVAVATSSDGKRKWTRRDEPVFTPSPEDGAWDAGAVGHPWPLAMSAGKWRLYYSGAAEGATPGRYSGIGLALSEGGEGGLPSYASFKRRTGSGN